MLSSAVVAVTPSIMLSSAVVAVSPSKISSSVVVTPDTATLPLAFDITARLAVRFASSMVVAAPVIVACLLLSCVWIAEVTPSI